MIVLYFLSAVFLICFWMTTSLYIVAWYDTVNLRSRSDDATWRKGIRYFTIIKGVLIESFCQFFHFITAPLRFYFDRIPKHHAPDDRPPILFVHGWGSGSHAFLYIYLFLRHYGFKNLYFITYRPVFAEIDVLARKVAQKIDFVLEKTGARKVNVISHSMGGVLTRYAIKNAGAEGKVSKLIALGGPHMGSRVAAFVPIGKNTLQLTYQSAFMRELATGGMTPGETRYVSIYSDFDNFVIPPDSSELGDGAKNIKVPFHGHLRLLYSYRVISLITKELAEV